MPTPEECAYAAGVLDSDGTMGIYKHTQTGSSFTRVSIGVQDDNLLLWLQSLWGGTIAHHSGTRVNKLTFNRQDDRRKFLVDLLPYLRTKKRVAEIILAHLNRGSYRSVAYDDLIAECKVENHRLSKEWKPWVKELSTDKQGGE